MGKYTVVYDRDESGSWIAQVRGVPEAHTYGRTIEQARERIREALALWRTDVQRAEFVDEVHLPVTANAVVEAVHMARRRLAREQIRAQKSALTAARQLTSKWGYSLRDAGELLGVSRQRVQQIKQPAATRTARGSAASKSATPWNLAIAGRTLRLKKRSSGSKARRLVFRGNTAARRARSRS